MYAGIKHAHLLFIVVSILLFELRFFLKLLKKPTGQLLKVIPHVNDTLLLISGFTLAFMASIKPWDQLWLGAKIIALVFYIGFGMMALKSNGAKSYLAYFLATLMIVFILFTSITKTPLFINL